MKKIQAKKQQFPFLYFGHGGWMPREEHRLQCFILFAKPPAKSQRSVIRRGLPRPVSSYSVWDERLFCFGSPDKYFLTENHIGVLLKKAYGQGPKVVGIRINFTKKGLERDNQDDVDELSFRLGQSNEEYGDQGPWNRFYQALDAWLLQVHKVFPITMFVRGVGGMHPDFSKWHKWSVKQLGSVIKDLEELSPKGRPKEVKAVIQSMVYELANFASQHPIPKKVGQPLLALMNRDPRHWEKWLLDQVVRKTRK